MPLIQGFMKHTKTSLEIYDLQQNHTFGTLVDNLSDAQKDNSSQPLQRVETIMEPLETDAGAMKVMVALQIASLPQLVHRMDEMQGHAGKGAVTPTDLEETKGDVLLSAQPLIKNAMVRSDQSLE